MLSKKKKGIVRNGISSTYAERFFTKPVPRFDIPKEGMDSNAAYQIVHDELNIDGNPSLNLASFVTTWMEDGAQRLITENLNKNLVDQDEYPQTGVIQGRVVNMLARLFHAHENNEYVGTATVGSSEAIMLGLLAHKWAFRKKMQKLGKDYSRPNIVVSADVHIVWRSEEHTSELQSH